MAYPTVTIKGILVIFLIVKNNMKQRTLIFFLPIEHISTRTIALNICRYISDKGYGAISTIEKKIESEYDLVKCTSDNYTLQYSNKIVKGIIKAGDLVCDALYLNPLANFKIWYTSYEK